MKKGIHPNYRPVIFLDAAVNFSFLTRSTVKSTETMVWTDGKDPILWSDMDISSGAFAPRLTPGR